MALTQLFLIILTLSAANAAAQMAPVYRSDRAELASPYFEETVEFKLRNVNFIRELFEREHVGLEIMFASASDKAMESRFGHIFLRFIDTDTNPYNDAVIGFKASDVAGRTPGPFDLLGRGRSIPILALGEELSFTLVNYQSTDTRDLKRYIIPAFPEQILKLKKVIVAVAQAPELLGSYNALNNNCFTALKKVLTEVQFPFYPSTFIDHMFDLDSYIQSSLITPYPAEGLLVIDGIRRPIEKLMVTIHSSYLKHRGMAVNTFECPENLVGEDCLLEYPNLAEAVSRLDDYSLGKLVNYWPWKWQQKLPVLIAEYRRRGLDKKTFKDFTNLPSFDLILYKACLIEDEQCRSERLSAATAIWPLAKLQQRQMGGAYIYAIEKKRAEDLPIMSDQRHSTDHLISSSNAIDVINFTEVMDFDFGF